MSFKARHKRFFIMLAACLLALSLISISTAPAVAQADTFDSLQVADIDTSRLTPRQYLYLIAAPNRAVARDIDRIASCESGWKMVKNSESTAYGYCQFLDGTWNTTLRRMGYDAPKSLRQDRFVNVDACVWLYLNDGIRHWLASQSCHKINS